MKRKTAEWFYKLHNKISNPKIEENVGDFRLMSREVVENIKLMPERNLFMKGCSVGLAEKRMLLNMPVPNAWPVIRNSTAGNYGIWRSKDYQLLHLPSPHLDVYRVSCRRCCISVWCPDDI